jgi:pseudo-rSAM protein
MECLILYNSTFVNITNKQVLFYNYENENKLLIENEEFYNLFSDYSIFSNTIKLTEDNIRNLKKIFNEIKTKNLGYILEDISVIPFQPSPIAKVENNVFEIDNADSYYVDNLLNIKNISIFLTGNNKISDTKKQLNFDFSNENKISLNIEDIKRFLFPLIHYRNQAIFNIHGIEHFDKKTISELVTFLKMISVDRKLNFVFNFNSLNNNLFRNNDIINNFITMFVNTNNFKKQNFDKLFWTNHNLNCIVSNEKDIDFWNNVDFLKELNYKLIPFFNKNNFDFFKQFVFLDNEIIMGSTASKYEILGNTCLNYNNFGKILINNNGEVYTNFHFKSLGNIKINTIQEIVKNAFNENEFWFMSRKNVEPCKNCIFNILCPSISNYELVLNCYNLCNIC